jgi:hypothetical protein
MISYQSIKNYFVNFLFLFLIKVIFLNIYLQSDEEEIDPQRFRNNNKPPATDIL